MGLALVIGACLALILLLVDVLPNWVRKSLLLGVFLLPPLGTGLALKPQGLFRWTAPSTARTRANVQALGYDVPWSSVKPCRSTPDPKGRDGVWVGGGQRWPSDREPDLIVLPGFRSHLVEICQEGEQVQARLVAPGTGFSASPNWEPGLDPRRYFSLAPADELNLQQVSVTGAGGGTAITIGPDDCFSVHGGPRIKTSDIIDFVVRESAFDGKAKVTKIRTSVLSLMERRPSPERNYLFCIDIARGLQRCGVDLADLRESVFFWRNKGKGPTALGEQWKAIIPRDASWQSCSSGNVRSIPDAAIATPENVSMDFAFSERSIATLPTITLEMIARRTRGGVADVAVPLENDRFNPSAFRLSAIHSFRFARQGDRLLIFAPEHPVQIRYDDLFGPQPFRSTAPGEFTLAFDESSGDDVLVADLTSAIDGLRPKLAFGNLPIRIRIPEPNSTRFEVTLPGLKPQWHSMGAIISASAALPLSNPQPAVLVLVSQASTPAGLWLVSAASALLIVLVWLLSKSADAWYYPRWTIVGMLAQILNVRVLLAAREVVESPSASSAYGDFLLATCFLILGPLVIAIPSIPAVHAQELFFSSTKKKRRQATTLVIASGLLCVVALITAACLIDIPTATGLVGSVAFGLFKTACAIGIAVLAGRTAYAWTSKRVQKVLGASAVGGFAGSRHDGSKQFLRWAWVSLGAGLFLLAARLALMFFGYQESGPFGLKLDVVFLPIAAGTLSALTGPGQTRTDYPSITMALLFCSLAFLGAGFAVNDLGLWWVGGMAIVLAVPFVTKRQSYAVLASAIVFGIFFLGPKLVPSEAVRALRYLDEGTEVSVNGNTVMVPDPLQASRQRDHYRLLDAIAPEHITNIPSELAREVMIERERLRYQALEGAWREGLRQPSSDAGPWFGAGAIQARPIFGEPAFMQAAKSDYVYLLYLRAEYGTIGILGLALVYASLFAAGAHHGSPESKRPFGLWALAIGAGCGLFMIGGTHGLFPFSGKWSLFLAIASPSDFCLGMSLLLLSGREVP